MNGQWLRLKCFDVFRRRRLHQDLDDELKAHIAIDVAQRIAEGEAPEEARQAALREVRSLDLVKENTRDSWTWNWLDDAWRDLRYAFRALGRSATFTIGAFLILSLGIGVNLGAFQFIDTVFWTDPPIREPASVVRFDWITRRNGGSWFPYPLTELVAANLNVLSAVLVQVEARGIVWGDEPNDQPRATFVSSNWFTELDYRPLLGRVFQPEVDDADAAPVVIITRGFWERRFNSDPDVIGKSVRINNRNAVIIGIIPASPIFQWTDATVWMPVSQMEYFTPGTAFKTSWDASISRASLFGRLRSGVSLAAAREASRRVMEEAAREHPAQIGQGGWLEPYSGTTHFRSADRFLRDILFFVSTGGGLSLLILLVASANLSNLILSRTVSRMRELSIRTALGAGRWRIIRHLMTESILLVAMGSAAGLVLVYWASRLIVVIWENTPDFTPDLRTVFAALVVAGFAVAVVGLLPALKVGIRDLSSAMKDGGVQASASISNTRWRRGMLAVQLGASCVLLVLTGLMLRSWSYANRRGFDVENVAVLSIPIQNYRITGRDALTFWAGVRNSLARHPEIESVALASRSPLDDGSTMASSDAPGLIIAVNEVDPEFFAIMRIPILVGRTFSQTDEIGSTAIISRRLAMTMYGTMDVVGKGYPKTTPLRAIIGVAADARLTKNQDERVADFYTLPDPSQFNRVLVVKARSGASASLKMMAETARNYDARVTAPNAHWLREDVDRATGESRTMSGLLSILGALALSITCVGVFGMVSYATLSRRKEIGIRIALGANRRSVTLTLIRQLTWPLAAGIVLGLMAAIPFGSMFAGPPLFVRPFDLTVSTIVAIILIGVAGFAAAWPAWRATRRDVLQSLRWE